MGNENMPSVIGRPAAARGGGVHVPARALDLSGIGDAVDGATRLAGLLVKQRQETNVNEAKRALIDANNELRTYLDKEVMQRRGQDAANAATDFESKFHTVRSKYGSKLTGEYLRMFNDNYDGGYSGLYGSVLNHQTRQTDAAASVLNKAGIQQSVELLAGNAADDNEFENLGGFITAEAQRIGVTNPEDIDKLARPYIDEVHGRRIAAMLKDNRVADAENYMKEIAAGSHPEAAGGTVAALNQEIARHRENADISTQSQEALVKIAATGGRYGNEEQNRIFADYTKRIAREYSGEKAEKGRRILSQLEFGYQLLERQQKAVTMSDTITAMKVIQDEKLNLAQEQIYVGNLADSPVKAALLKAHDRKLTAAKKAHEEFNGNKDIAFVAQQEEALTQFKLDFGNGQAELDGLMYDLNDPKQTIGYIRNLGFTDKNAKRAYDYTQAAEKRVDAWKAARVLGELTKKAPAEALKAYPNLLLELEARKGKDVIEDKDLTNWLKLNISDLLMQEMSNDNGWWFTTSNSREKYVGKGLPAGEQFMTRKQMTKALQKESSSRALYRGDTEGVRDAERLNPDSLELDHFASQRGYEVKNGYFYLRGK